MGQTDTQAAESLAALLPQTVSPALLDEYGLETTPDQAKTIVRELLSVNLYWMRNALQTVLTKPESERVWLALREHLRTTRKAELGSDGQAPQEYFEEVEERRQAYDRIARDGGEPVAVLTECAEILETAKAVQADERSKVLALLIDLVPVDEIGEAVEALDLAGT